MTISEIRAIIRAACEVNGCADLADKIPVKWSNRMTSAMGKASYRIGGGYSITLSAPLFDRASYDERVQTIAHEACHVIDGYINDRRMSHGPTWKACMRRAGYAPARCHSVSNAGLVRRYVYVCPNGCSEYRISTRMHNSIERGQHRVCRRCRSTIKYTGQVEGA